VRVELHYRQSEEVSLGIGFYPTNINGESRWGATDFDAHNGEIWALIAHRA